MRHFVYFFILIVIISACQQNSNDASKEIVQLEEALKSDPSPQNASALIKKYLEHAESLQNPDKRENLLSKASQTALDQKAYGQAMGVLQKLILDYPESSLTTSRLLQISDIFNTLRRDDAHAILLRSMAEKYPSNADIQESINKFSVPEISSDSLISALGIKMFNDTLLQLNKPAARQYVDGCEAFAMVMQGDERSAEYLHKGAETARSLQTIDKALFLYDWIIEKYPNHERAAQSLFLKAFTLDNNLKQFDQAKVIYEDFLEKYPENEFAASAQFLLENLGKSDEELLEALQKKGETVD